MFELAPIIGQAVQVLIFLGTLYGFFIQVRTDNKNQLIRLDKIETEIVQFRQFLINSARLEEQIKSLRETVLAQGKRIDRIIYGWQEEDDDRPNR